MGSMAKEPAPDPLISITKHPPRLSFVNQERPAYLECEATYTGPPLEYDSYDEDEHSTYQDETNEPNPILSYQWYRNDVLLPNRQNSNNFVIFQNGTLKVKYSQTANGIYRCLANCTLPNVGAVVSNAAEVKVAGENLHFDKKYWAKKACS